MDVCWNFEEKRIFAANIANSMPQDVFTQNIVLSQVLQRTTQGSVN
jgi:hypothetical protein